MKITRMTEQELRTKLTEIESSANPQLLCRELDDQTLLDLIKIEKRFPFYLAKWATEEYQRRMVSRNRMYRKDPPPNRNNWTADPQ